MKINLRKNFIDWGSLVLLGILALEVLVPVSPYYQPVPRRDSGVFLYVGQHILEGQVPYRDMWDHKGPVIYYLNALGIFLANGSRWGVFTLEVVSLCIAVSLCYLSLKTAFGWMPALFGTAIWVNELPKVLNGGNLVEEYSLPLQFGGLYLFILFGKDRKNNNLLLFLIGVCFALSFFLRPNNIGIFIAIILTILGQVLFSKGDYGKLLQQLKHIVLGSFCIVLIVIGYFASQKALGQFGQAVFLYNFSYVLIPDRSRVEILNQIISIFAHPLKLAFVSWGLLCVSIFYTRFKIYSHYYLNVIFLIALPIELFFVLLASTGYLHYFIAILPIIGLLGGFFAYFLRHTIHKIFPDKIYRICVDICLVGILLFIVGHPIQQRFHYLSEFVQVSVMRRGPPPTNISEVEGISYIKYIMANTGKNDKVLFWGNELAYNFITERASVTPYIYIYPLIWPPEFATESMLQQFLIQLKTEKPLIIDTSRSNTKVIAIESELWEVYPKMHEIIQFIREEYQEVGSLEPFLWPILEYRESTEENSPNVFETTKLLEYK